LPCEGVSWRMRHNGDAIVPFCGRRRELFVIGWVLREFMEAVEGSVAAERKRFCRRSFVR
jgi:hypothetical protein